jgi:hypothetical protein
VTPRYPDRVPPAARYAAGVMMLALFVIGVFLFTGGSIAIAQDLDGWAFGLWGAGLLLMALAGWLAMQSG